jgi:Leucine-rich repeat (LRR) protein
MTHSQNTDEEIEHVKQLLFSDTPELAFKILTNWDKDHVSQHFEMFCPMFPLLCLEHLPYLLDGYDQLNFESRQLTNVPVQVGELKHLRTLILRDNSLSSLPTELWQLGTLVNLDLGANLFEDFPAVLGQLTNLRTLNLEANDIAVLPPAIGKLTCLISLDLNDNKLTSLPKEIQQLTQLQQLELINNPLPKQTIEQLHTWLPNCDIKC